MSRYRFAIMQGGIATRWQGLAQSLCTPRNMRRSFELVFTLPTLTEKPFSVRDKSDERQLNLIANKSATQLHTGGCPQADRVRLNHISPLLRAFLLKIPVNNYGVIRKTHKTFTMKIDKAQTVSEAISDNA